MSSGVLSRESVRPPAPPPATLTTTASGASAEAASIAAVTSASSFTSPPTATPRPRVATSSLPASRARSKTTTCMTQGGQVADGGGAESPCAAGHYGRSLIPFHCRLHFVRRMPQPRIELRNACVVAPCAGTYGPDAAAATVGRAPGEGEFGDRAARPGPGRNRREAVEFVRFHHLRGVVQCMT